MRAIELDPEYAQAHVMVGATYGQGSGMAWNLDPGLWDRAEDHFQQCLELDPSVPDCYRGLAVLAPPYNQGLAPPALTALAVAGWLTADALAIVELMAKEPFEPPAGFTLLEERKYGKARLAFLRRRAGRGSSGTVGQ